MFKYQKRRIDFMNKCKNCEHEIAERERGLLAHTFERLEFNTQKWVCNHKGIIASYCGCTNPEP